MDSNLSSYIRDGYDLFALPLIQSGQSPSEPVVHHSGENEGGISVAHPTNEISWGLLAPPGGHPTLVAVVGFASLNPPYEATFFLERGNSLVLA